MRRAWLSPGAARVGQKIPLGRVSPLSLFSKSDNKCVYGGGGGEGEEEQEREERHPPCQPKAHTNGAGGIQRVTRRLR